MQRVHGTVRCTRRRGYPVSRAIPFHCPAFPPPPSCMPSVDPAILTASHQTFRSFRSRQATRHAIQVAHLSDLPSLENNTFVQANTLAYRMPTQPPAVIRQPSGLRGPLLPQGVYCRGSIAQHAVPQLLYTVWRCCWKSAPRANDCAVTLTGPSSPVRDGLRHSADLISLS